ncbi:zinc ribbon domain-containing protein [Desulfoscipio gibsoniae]|uniref:zinc ribbon domain-containing protein n=1 Tax=Desulfoscipio gibsoniae TaxID=102134 RepID=UPI0009FBACC5|nr:zinc ribbon domain-containing protein [Desulfoscipio gibsoniae]
MQAEIERHKKLGRPVSCHGPFSAKIICGECGGFYGSKVWGSNTKYRRTIWRCNEKYKKDKPCQTLHLTEDDIKHRFKLLSRKQSGGDRIGNFSNANR